jgi:hypothetical protein
MKLCAFWLLHTLISAFFLLCEIEVTYGVAADFGGAVTTGEKTGQVLFRFFGFPLLSSLWDTPYFEGPAVWWLVMVNSAVWAISFSALWHIVGLRLSR